MNIFCLQTILAAPEDVDKWMNILFVVVLAVFWVLRGLFRDKIQESENKSDSEKQPTRKPVQRSSDRARALWDQFLEQTRGPSESPSQKSGRAPVTHQRKPGISKSVIPKGSTVSEKPVISSSISKVPDFGLDIKNLPETSDVQIKDLNIDSKRIGTEITDEGLFAETLLDFSDPDELRKAILKYEILGKPLSIRSQGDNF
jgi:hypothetical protein